MTSKIRTCIRTTILKVRHDDEDLVNSLNATAEAIGKKAAIMRDFLVACRGEEYWDGTDTVTQNQVEVSQLRYCKSDPAALRPLLRQFYDLCMTSDHNVVISYVSPMYKSDSRIALATRKNKKTGLPNAVDPGKLLARQLLEMGVFPIVADDLPASGMVRAAWIEAFTTIRSWHEADIRYRDETLKLQNRLTELETQAAALPEEFGRLFWDLLLAADQGGRKIDRFFTRRWATIRRGLLTGLGLRQGEAEFFEPFRDLWEEKDYLLIYLEIEGIKHQLTERQVGAKMPSFDDHVTILLSVSGTNTVPVNLESHQNAVVGTLELIDHDQPDETKDLSFRCYPSRYFRRLDLKTAAKGGTSVATASYQKGNIDKIPVSAEIKEPRLRRRGSQWYIDFIQNVAVAPATERGNDMSSLFKQLGYFISTKSDLPAGQVEPGLRILSIDLGINPVLAYSVYYLGKSRLGDDSLAVPEIGWANPQGRGLLGETKSLGYHESIVAFRRRLQPLKVVIRFRGRLLNKPDEPMDQRYIDSVIRAFGLLGWEYTTDLATLKQVLFDEMVTMRRRYRSLANSTERRTGISREQFEWTAAIGEFIQLLKTWEYNGPKKVKDETVAVNPPGKDRPFSNYYNYMNNLKKDVIRKVAAEIRKLALLHRVDAVLVEDLEYFTQSIRNEKGTNSLLALWAPNTILKWIENALEPHGIVVLRVDPRQTSRIDPRTGEFGFNDFKAAKEVLLVERDGQLEMLNADLAAADNLQRRFWSRNSDIYRLDCYPDAQGAVPVLGDTTSASYIRTTRYFEAEVGSKYARITEGRLEPLTAKEYKKAVKDAESKKSERYYRHEGRWLPFEEHVKAIESLFDRLAADPPDSEIVQRFVGRVKAFRGRKTRVNT